MNIHVSNLSHNTIDSDLRKLFAKYGGVESAVVIRDIINGRSRGTALINMVNAQQGQNAISYLHKSVFDGKVLTVNEIKYSVRDYKN